MEIEKVTFEKTFIITDIVLMSIGIRPSREFSPPTWSEYFIKNIWFILTFSILFYAATGEVLYLLFFLKEKFSFLAITTQFFCVGFCSIGLLKMMFISKRRNALAEIVRKLKEYWPKCAETKEQKEMIESYMLVCIAFTTVFSIINVLMVSAFNFLPMFEMLYNRIVLNLSYRQLPYNIWFPFDPYDGPWYYLIYCYHAYAGHIVVMGNMGFDFLFAIPTAHLCMHYKILREDVRMVVQDGNAKDILKEEQIRIGRLKSFADRHQVLIEFREYLQDVFSDVIFFNFFGSSIIICLVGFQVTTVTFYNLIKFTLFLLCSIIEVYLLCWYGQELIDNSTGLGDSAYNCSWYMACPKFKKMLLFFIHRSQIAQKLTALSFWEVSMQSFSKILSASWSYFTLLKTINGEVADASALNAGL